MKLVHIGSGKNLLPDEWVNVDVRPVADIQAPAHDLPFEDNSVDALYACHVLEHYPLASIPEVFKEWQRVLVPQASRVYIAVPDIQKLAFLYGQGTHLVRLRGLFWGGQSYPENYHYTGWDYETLAMDMRPYFFNIKRTEFKFLPDEFRDFSMMEVNGIPCSLNVEGIAI